MKSNLLVTVLAISLLGGGPIAQARYNGGKPSPADRHHKNLPQTDQPEQPVEHDQIDTVPELIVEPLSAGNFTQGLVPDTDWTVGDPTYPIEDKVIDEYFACRGSVTIYREDKTFASGFEFWGKGATKAEAVANSHKLLNVLSSMTLEESISKACEEADLKGNIQVPYGSYEGYCQKYITYQSAAKGESYNVLVDTTQEKGGTFSCAGH